MKNKLFSRYSRRISERVRDRFLGRKSAIFAHPVCVPAIPYEIVADMAPDDEDVLIAQRLLAAYSKCMSDEPPTTGKRSDIWSGIKQRQHEFFGTLNTNDPELLAAYLCNMCRHDATQGTVQGADEHQKLRTSRSYQRFVARLIKDKLVSLAEAVGAIAVENPEQGQWGLNYLLDIDHLVDRIEEHIGTTIAPPPIDGGLFKIRYRKGLFHERDCNAVFTAWSMNQLVGRDPAPNLCEIGGGTGRVAYWACRFGLTNYTIYDLPHINVLQGFYLLKSLPSAPVALYGEPDGPRGLKVKPYFARSAEPGQFDLVLNQDSFPEIHPDTVREYLRWIRQVARSFLSINHENKPAMDESTTQVSVPEIVSAVGGYRRQSRNLYWLRRGYVMELYRVE